MLRMTVLGCGACASDCEGLSCACAKAGAPRERAAMMTDAVTMRMLTPFSSTGRSLFAKFGRGLIPMWPLSETNAAAMRTPNACGLCGGFRRWNLALQDTQARQWF